MTDFFSRLEDRVRAVDSLLCVGLDPHPGDLPEDSAQAAYEFCLRLIETIARSAAAFKPNAAFFEAYGGEGIEVLRKVIAAIPDGIPVILDAKRGDIASTAEAYARAAFKALGADAITISPYLGRDSVEPFLKDPENGVFLLCKTSNPSASDFQDQVIAGTGETLFERVARTVDAWEMPGQVGLVVGATYPEEMRRVRRLAPQNWILAPGVGAQGGDLEAALRAGLREDGMGLLVPVSRGISRAADPSVAAEEMRIAINFGREKSVSTPSTFTGSTADLADGLVETGCVKFGRFTLKSGLQSPIYIDLRRLASSPRLLGKAAVAYLPLLRNLCFVRLAALPYAALPIGTAISLNGGWPMIYPRKESKTYGTKAEIEGEYYQGERVVVIDDLATTGGSKFEAIEKLTLAGLEVQDVVVLIDRESGAREALEDKGYRLHAVFTLTGLLEHWEQTGLVERERIEAVREFLRS